MRRALTPLALSLLTLPALAATEEEIMKDVKVPEAFETTLFAAPPAVNYPVFVAAAPDGTLFVSSDGNGSLGRDPKRGRIIRLRDTNGDGRADESKDFVPDVDSPRGLVWDHDRLYVMHPPHLSVFIDKDGDGISDEKKVLVKGLAFGFDKRPADHTTNGLAMGVDGWLYVAVGDFGFPEAEGTDRRKLQLRGGGIVRVRPDGSGLELYSRGTRNIVEAPISPLLDLFSRDNTNDGGGWDLRLHHFSGYEDHGYPRLFKSFSDEVIKPLADYGGGSGCGGAWIDEPGYPADWNNRLYTSDWGKNPIFKHDLVPAGATFKETKAPAEFVKLTRSTDLDVDALSNAYVSSWKGATFKWNGPEVGYIVRVRPKGHQSAALPDFAKQQPAALVELLRDASYRRRLAAQRELLRRPVEPGALAALQKLANEQAAPLSSRVAAIFTLQQWSPAAARPVVTALAADPTVAAWAIRALADRVEDANFHDSFLAGLKSQDARVRKESIIALARAHGISGVAADGGTPTPETLRTSDLAAHAAAIAPLLADADATVVHTAMQVLRTLAVAEPHLATVDNKQAAPAAREGALSVLRGIHTPAVVAALATRLAAETDAAHRQGLLTALCRLHFVEGQWNKNDSWGTRPDTRGPYYQPETWSESERIAGVLTGVMEKAGPAEATFLAGELSRHRIRLGDALQKLITLAQTEASVLPALTAQLAAEDAIPAAAVPLLIRAAGADSIPEVTRAYAVQALVKTDSAEAIAAALRAMPKVAMNRADNREVDKARDGILSSPKMEAHHGVVEEIAAAKSGKESAWADAVLVKIAARKNATPESKQMATQEIENGWKEPARRAQIIEGIVLAKDNSRAAMIVAVLEDPDKDVAKAAKEAVKTMKIDVEKIRQPAAAKTEPLIATLQPEAVLKAVMKEKGDAARGEQLFTQQGCMACHAVSADQPQRGPFLGNIASLYKRRELAEAIIQPNKTIAQGFATNVFELKDGSPAMGFVTNEAADAVTIRDIAGQERTIKVADIAKRQKDEKSMMPEGLAAGLTVSDLASLIRYLEDLATK